jgi:hypothetical protein
MTQQQYLQHCRQMASSADRVKARPWVLNRNPSAHQQRLHLFHMMDQ